MGASPAEMTGQHIMLAAEYLHFGGTRTYLLRLLDLYYRHGAHVTLVSTLLREDPEMRLFLDQRGFDFATFPDAMATGVKPRAGGHPTVWSWREYRRERDAFRIFAARIQATRAVVSVGTAGLLLSAAAALPDPIVIAHGYPHGRRQELLGRRYLSRFIPRRTTFITVSDFERRIIESLWNLRRSGSRAVTILSTDGSPALNHSSDRPPWSVLTASLVEPYKRPHDWIEVAEEVIGRFPAGTVQFTWLGEGSLLDAARVDAAGRTSAAAIQFPGLALDPSPDYVQARLYLQLSSIENLSLSTLCAQRHGIPCVVTDTGGFREIINDGENGYVVPCGDVQALADAVTRLLSNAHLWNEQSATGKDLYTQRFSPERWETQIIGLTQSTTGLGRDV